MTTQAEAAGGPPWMSEYPRTARAVMRACGTAALATAQRDADGWPYPSLVLVALDLDATPILLISTLADHTKNALSESRAGLLFDGTAGLAEPLTGPRVSVLGRLERTDDPRLRDRFLARHPSAAAYAGFGDFGFFRLVPERAHLVAGFGRIRWIPAADLILPCAAFADLADRVGDIVAHMNDDHADALELYAQVLMKQAPGAWRMTGIDPEGCDLVQETVTIRLPFPRMVATAEQARKELVLLVKEARTQTGREPSGPRNDALDGSGAGDAATS